MLLKELYRAETGEDLPEIRTTDRGKPYFPDSGWYFSISHTPKHAFCVLSRHNVGLDAEELDRAVNPKLAERILSDSEYAQYEKAPDQNRALLTFWVLKEAAAKLSGEGLKAVMGKTALSLTDPRVQTMAGCLVAVVTEDGRNTMIQMKERNYAV